MYYSMYYANLYIATPGNSFTFCIFDLHAYGISNQAHDMKPT